MEDTPPPPPPHGTDGRHTFHIPPDAKFDVFFIPPPDAGGGFLYIPSMRPSRNSFLVGFATGLAAVAFWNTFVPSIKEWLAIVAASGGMGVFLLIIGVGIAGWAWGKTQGEAGAGPDKGTGGTGGAAPNQGPRQSAPNGYANAGPSPQPAPTSAPESKPQPTPQNQQQSGAHQSAQSSSEPKPRPTPSASAGWEKAREETRRREEERKAQEELRRKREESEKQARAAAEKEKWERMRAREKEAREREARERILRERLAKEKENREREAREKEAREREAREKEAKEKEAREQEAREKEARAKEAERASSQTKSYGVGERTDPYSRPATQANFRGVPTSAPSTPSKKYEKPTAQSLKDDGAYSFRPYDQPKRPAKASSQSSFYSESSYAPSQSTARTTPPPPNRVPYSTKDPDKIVIKAVYLFNDLFPRPVANLISGVGSVTDGLILRITTEGLFIDDDVRSVPQREWDVRAWTLKLVEVRCPQFAVQNTRSPSTLQKKDPVHRFLSGGGGSANKSVAALSNEETDLLLEKLLLTCKASCAGPQASNVTGLPQSGDAAGKHVLRATIRDTEGKKYVFIIGEEEGWKVAVGLQRLRRGTQVRALGVSGLPAGETQKLLTSLGWS